MYDHIIVVGEVGSNVYWKQRFLEATFFWVGVKGIFYILQTESFIQTSRVEILDEFS